MERAPNTDDDESYWDNAAVLKKQDPEIPRMAGFSAYRGLAPKTKNLVVAGGLTAFVFGVYFYTMRAVGGSDELQVAIDKFEEEKHKSEAQAGLASKA